MENTNCSLAQEGPLFSVPSNAANGDSLTSGVSEKPSAVCASSASGGG